MAMLCPTYKPKEEPKSIHSWQSQRIALLPISKSARNGTVKCQLSCSPGLSESGVISRLPIARLISTLFCV